MAFGVTSVGFNRKTIADIKSEIEQELRSSFGQGLNLEPESVFGQIVGVFSEQQANAWEMAEDVFNSYYPGNAEGVALDNVASITGSVRKTATASTVANQLLFGTAGTLVPAGRVFSVLGSPSSRFNTLADVTLVAGTDEIQRLTLSDDPASGTFRLSFGGQSTSILNWDDTASEIQTALEGLSTIGTGNVSVSGTLDQATGLTITFLGDTATGLGKRDVDSITFSDNTLLDGVAAAITITIFEQTKGVPQGTVNLQAQETGPTVAPTGSLTVIDTPVVGLDEVVNQVDAIIGENEESDADFRARRDSEVAIAGAGTPDAIFGDISNVSGVTAVIVFFNNTDLTDSEGRPPHSVDVVVDGGDNQDIADALFQTVGGGIGYVGDITVPVTQADGFTSEVKFSRPTDIEIYVEVDLTTNSLTFPANGAQQVIDSILAYGLELTIGQDIVVYGSDPSLSCAWRSVLGITDFAIRVGVAPGPTLDDNISIARREVAKFDSARITVNVL